MSVSTLSYANYSLHRPFTYDNPFLYVCKGHQYLLSSISFIHVLHFLAILGV